jgi:transcriptional regulator with XRE-family HTH domain
MRRRYDPAKASVAFGKRVRAMRMAKGWSLEECEEHGWPSWRQLQRIETGHNPTLKSIVNIANLFGVHPKVLLEEI